MINLNKNRWGRHFSDSDIEHARKSHRLLTMEIETSHICNLRCIYCYNCSGKVLNNELSTKEIFNVIDQGIDLGLRRVIIIGGGEPLMHPDIMKIINFIHKKELGIDLFTNGTLITKDLAKTLYELDVEPVIKLNSLKPDVQDFLVNKKGTFDKIHKAIEYLQKAGYPDKDHDMGVESIICSYNYDEISEIWRWARDRNIIPYIEMITFQGRAKKRSDLNVPVEDLKKLFYKLSKIDKEEYGHEWEPHPPIAALSCSRHEYSCTIDSRGYVLPCTGVNIKVGNIRHEKLENILKQSVIINCLRNIRKNIKGECKTCSLLEKCYGCRGMAYHISGDFLAPDPLCWHNTEHLKIHRIKKGKTDESE